jgi:hypothetical protein
MTHVTETGEQSPESPRKGAPLEPVGPLGHLAPLAPDAPRVVWTREARRKLLPRRSGQAPSASRVHKPGLLTEIAELARECAALDPSAPWSRSELAPWKEVRRLLAQADADTYSGAREAASSLRAAAPARLRFATSFAFATETAWSAEDAALCLEAAAAGQAIPPGASILFASIADADLARRLILACPPGSARFANATYALELVASIGPDAAGPLTLLLDEALAHKEDRDAARRCLEGLEIIQSEDVAAALARHLDVNEVRPFAARYFRDAPHLAVKALAPLSTARGRAGEAAKTLLLSAVTSIPEVVESVLPELGGAGRRGVKAAREQAKTPYEEASAEELPAILVRPPWRDKDGRRTCVIEDLSVIDLPPPEDAGARSRDAWAAKIHWVPNALVFSPRVAFPVAHAWIHRAEARAAADAWLTALPGVAATGLIPAAVGNPCAARTDAGRILRMLAGRGFLGDIREAARRYGDEVASALEEVLALDPILDCPESPPKLPDFLLLEALPRPRLAERPKVIPLFALRSLVEMLTFSSEDFPYAGIDVARAACDRASLAELGWAIVAAWLAAGGSMKYGFCLRALGEIGGDLGARRLAPKIRAWPGEKATARALAGVDALARIGTDVALMHLSAIAETTRFLELAGHARAKIAAVAEARGLSADELGDRLVPDLDLDRDGSKALDYGPRSFRVSFDEHLAPLVKDASGAALRSLPKPSKADDAEKAKAAQSVWKSLRDDTEVIARAQILRLELAMATRRMWSQDDHRAFLLEHPLLVHLVRRLVWGAYDAEGRLVATFRVAEDRSLADERDAPLTLSKELRVGIPHALDLSPEQMRAWGGVFADYAILQPFAQLGRETFVPTEEERASSVLRRVEGVKVSTGKLFGIEHRGWRREAHLPDVVSAYKKELSPGRHFALFEIEPGIQLTRARETPEQRLSLVALTRSRPYGVRAVFGELDPIVFSELVRDLEILRG